MKYKRNRHRKKPRPFYQKPSYIILSCVLCCCLFLWGYLGYSITTKLGLGRKSKLSLQRNIESIERPILKRGHREYNKLTKFLRHENDAILQPLHRMEDAINKIKKIKIKSNKAKAEVFKLGTIQATLPNEIEPNTAALRGAAAADLSRGDSPQIPTPPQTLQNIPPQIPTPPQEPPLQPQPEEEVPPTTTPQLPIGKTALVVICYNRPEYLQRTLNSVLKHHHKNVDVFVSQDGSHAAVSNTIDAFVSKAKSSTYSLNAEHLHHTNQARGNGYEKLAIHFGWILKTLFDERKYNRVILLEDDMEIAPDFFSYFLRMAPLYDSDDTIMAISAFNDNGFQGYVNDPTKVVRSDYFPGLGWMINARMWKEWGSKWPKGYWDDWLREPPQRKNRVTLRPEISRSFTFGRRGVSVGQFYDKFLGRIKLNDVQVNWNQVPSLNELANKKEYDLDRNFEINSAALIDLNVARKLVTDVSFSSSYQPSQKDFKIEYQSLDKGGGLSFMMLARQLKIMDSIKAKVPRTAYMGTLYIRLIGTKRRLFIVKASHFRDK